MRDEYERQVALLIDVLPFVAQAKVFALKGGTAINFFYLDCPRLSVDIDLHYLPDYERERALADIETNMQAIAEGIQQAYPGAKVQLDPKTLNALVVRQGIQIKIEPNTVIRGGLLAVEQKTLSPYLEQKYGRTVTVSCVAKHELYAGKLCAALNRQHPRDLFDARLFLSQNSLSSALMDTFVIYLISQGKPIHEELNPNIQDVEALYHKQFTGMALEEIALEHLIELQAALPQRIVASLTEKHRQFLLGFKQGNPDWSLLPFASAKSLPAVRWKQLNLEKMDGTKRQYAFEKLKQLFEAVPYNPENAQMNSDEELAVLLPPQEQLAADIVDALTDVGLIGSEKKKLISQQIANGKLTREDWSLLIELSLQAKADGDSND